MDRLIYCEKKNNLAIFDIRLNKTLQKTSFVRLFLFIEKIEPREINHCR